jgi:hypothetical protein
MGINVGAGEKCRDAQHNPRFPNLADEFFRIEPTRIVSWGTELLHDLTVDGEVVLAAQGVVVHLRDARGGVEALGVGPVLAHCCVLLETSSSGV